MLRLDTKVARHLPSFAEFLPLLTFVYAGRFDAELSERFFWGAGTVIAVIPLLMLFRYRPNPLLVAVNIWLCIEAFAFLVHIPPLAQALQTLRESAFFVSILLVGTVYIAFSKKGLLTVASTDQTRVRRYSFGLLILSVGGLVCSMVFRGNEMIAAVVPATVLFLAQMMMNAQVGHR